MNTGYALHLHVSARVANVALGRVASIVLMILLATAGGADHGRRRDAVGSALGRLDGLWLGGSSPARDLPLDTSEGLEAKASPVPFATGLAAAVERTQTGVDSSLVCFGTESVGIAACWLESTVLAIARLVWIFWSIGHVQVFNTYSRCLFLGPGFPLAFASPFAAAAPADLLTPFFLSGGPMVDGAGVPPLAPGVAGAESEAGLSAFKVAEAATGVESGEIFKSFIGVSSLVRLGVGLVIACSLSGETLRTTIFASLAAEPEDLRGLSFADAALFGFEGAIAFGRWRCFGLESASWVALNQLLMAVREEERRK